ncbi:MAG: hypothetical protein ACMG6S_14315, partial [Byssovorax sp.]
MGDQGTLRVMRTGGSLSHRNAVRKKVTALRVERLAFLTDHGLLTNKVGEKADWKSGGKRYVTLEGGAHWKPAAGKSFPASVTKGTTLQIDLELSVGVTDTDPMEGTIQGEPSGGGSSPEPFLQFEGKLVVGGDTKVKLSLTAKGPLPDEIVELGARSIAWKVTLAGETFDLGSTGPHRFYLTYGTPDPGGLPMPTPFGPQAAPVEDGITEKRMSAAVALTHEMLQQADGLVDPDTNLPRDRNDPHVIVEMLFRKFTTYTLLRDKSLAVFNHPSYFNNLGGAWPMAQFFNETGECQAIVRLIRAVLMQIGCPGDAKHVVVFATVDVDNGATALEDDITPPDSDKTKYRLGVNGKMQVFGGLERDKIRFVKIKGVNRPVVLGLADQLVDPGNVLEARTVLNAYEACLKFTFGGKMRYYGGGVPGSAFTSALEVLHVFASLVWWSE